MPQLDQIIQELSQKNIIRTAKQRKAIREALVDYAFAAMLDSEIRNEVETVALFNNCDCPTHSKPETAR